MAIVQAVGLGMLVLIVATVPRNILFTGALAAGGFGIVALVLALRVANRLVALPVQEMPDLSQVPAPTMALLLLLSAPVAGVIEEAAFRGYMQGPIERRHGLVVAILITGTMFAVAHLDFTLVLWPYYVAVAAICTRTSICGCTAARNGRLRQAPRGWSGRPAPTRHSGP